MSNSKHRQLNIELLRIVSMLLITLWHAKVHFLNSMEPYTDEGINTLMQYIVMFIPFHVNLFILITGFFGVKDNRKGLIRIFLLLYFYSITLTIVTALLGEPIDWMALLFPFSCSDWWFMRIYLILLVVAPLIEHYIVSASRAEFRILVIAALIINIWTSWVNHAEHIYGHGYDLFNFIAVYLVGVWLRKAKWRCQKRYIKTKLSIGMLCLVTLQYKAMGYGLSVNLTDYNSLYALLMAIAVFLFAINTHVSSRLANPIMFFSSSAVASYLITDFPQVKALLYPYFSQVITKVQDTSLQILLIVLMVIAAFIISCLIDKIRVPVTSALSKFLFKKFNIA